MTALRHLRQERAPSGTMAAADENSIELLAMVFDIVFAEPAIAPGMKDLLGKLQLPLMKLVLRDRDFFFNKDNPACRLLDLLTQSSTTWEPENGCDDPFFNMVEQIVERIAQEIEPHSGLFSDAMVDLENFFAAEETLAENTLADAIADVVRQEKLRHARERAESDVAARIETGEVAGFVEVFLERQWVKILTLAHNVADTKPDTLVRVQKAMDELIWSVKPKTSPEERKELVGRLPAMLSLINAWLNVLNWEEPERRRFLAKLAERHAAIVRAPIEFSTRLQVELAVNVAQKASERLLSRRAKAVKDQPDNQFTCLVDGLQCGEWVEFVRKDGSRVKSKLTWISPRRSRFILMNRQGQCPLLLTADELTQHFRNQTAVIAPMTSVIDRALEMALGNRAAQ